MAQILLGSREDQEARLQKAYDDFVKGLEDDLAKGSITKEEFDRLEDTYSKGLWEAIRAVFNHSNRPRCKRINLKVFGDDS